YQKIAMATAIGFAIMGFIGFFVKLIHIPMTSTVEQDLTEKLETSSLEAAKHEISIGKEAADMIKAQANEAFKNGDYETATELYSKAIEIHPDAILYSNRSFAYLRREWYGYALIDAKKALEYDSKYIKVMHFVDWI
ncbi:unnamed protein product, partial [Rotaria magnacalcarata]